MYGEYLTHSLQLRRKLKSNRRSVASLVASSNIRESVIGFSQYDFTPTLPVRAQQSSTAAWTMAESQRLFPESFARIWRDSHRNCFWEARPNSCYARPHASVEE